MSSASTLSGNLSNPYAYQKPSTVATRSLITGDKPSEVSPPSKQDVEGSDKFTLVRRTTNNYEEAKKAAGQNRPANATTGAIPSGTTDRPGLDRQQSWNYNDLKRDQHQNFMSGQAPSGAGYSSTDS